MTKIPLSHPITIDGTKVTELNMRRPKVADHRAAHAAGKDDATRELTLIANLCTVKVDDLNELDLADYLKLQGTLKGFLS